MVLNVHLKDGKGGSQAACCTSRGELVINRFDYSTAYTASATVINTGYNIIEPKTGQRFVVTSMVIATDRNVGATNGALINIYEANSDSSTTSIKDLIPTNLELVKQQRIVLDLNMIITEGVWVNLKTDDNNVSATIYGYYVPA